MLERTSAGRIAKLEKLGWDKLMEEFASDWKTGRCAPWGGQVDRSGGRSPSVTGVHTGGHPSRWSVEGWEVGRQGMGRCAVIVMTTTRSRLAPVTSRSRYAAASLRREGAELELNTMTRSSRPRRRRLARPEAGAERHNTVKVLMLLDVGGTMDEHIKRTEELFSAAKSEFQTLPPVLLLSQLCVRVFVAGESATLYGVPCNLGRASKVSARLEVDFCRRCHDEPDDSTRRLGRVQQ